MTPQDYADLKRFSLYDKELWAHVESNLWRFACLFELPLKFVEPILCPTDSDIAYGWCDVNTGQIAIALRWRDEATGRWDKSPLSARLIVETAAHELAHLKHRGHGKKHKRFTKEIFSDMQLFGLIQEVESFRKNLLALARKVD